MVDPRMRCSSHVELDPYEDVVDDGELTTFIYDDKRFSRKATYGIDKVYDEEFDMCEDASIARKTIDGNTDDVNDKWDRY